MEYQIPSMAAVSCVSGDPFQPGERICSSLFVASDGAIVRLDCREPELSALNPHASLLCRWSQVMRDPGVSEAELRRVALRSSEEVFLQLFEDDANATDDDPAANPDAVRASRDRLKFFLALQLERKRILRSASPGSYLHVKSKRLYAVPQLPLDEELLRAFGNELASAFGGH